MSRYTLDKDQQIIEPKGGEYVISTFLNGGTALLEVQQSASSNWSLIGTLTDGSSQTLKLPYEGRLRITKTGNALVEISR